MHEFFSMEAIHAKPTPTQIDLKTKIKENQSRLIIYFKALGLKNKEIAVNLGISAETVGRTLRSNSAQDELRRVQMEIMTNHKDEIFKNVIPLAVKAVTEILVSKRSKSSTRLQAAMIILDRALGKPTQEIKQEVTGFRELIDALDREEKRNPTVVNLGSQWYHSVEDSEESQISKQETGGDNGRSSKTTGGGGSNIGGDGGPDHE